MANFFTNATDITPGTTGAWVDIDVSAYCPADTTGVIVQVVNNVDATRAWGLRKPGSADNRTTSALNLTQNWGYIGVNSSRVLQGYVGGSGIQFKLLGYFTSDGAFFTNAYNKTPGTNGWINIDCSAQIPAGAKFAVVEILYGGGLRPTGSTDDRRDINGIVHYHGFALVGLDANRTFGYYHDSSAWGDFVYLVGYLTAGTFKLNGVEITPSSPDVYVNIDRSGDVDASGAAGVLVEAYGGGGVERHYSLRKNGSTDDFYQQEYHAWPAIGLDTNKVFQAKIGILAGTPIRLYVLGYLAAPPPPSWTYTGDISLALLPQSDYAFPQVWQYVGNIPLSLLPQGVYGLPIAKEYIGDISLTLLPQSVYYQEWQYQGDVQLGLIPASSYSWFLGWIYAGNIPLSLSPAGDYFAVMGRNPIPVPYVLRYPSPRNGQTNVPVRNGIRFKLQSDTAGIDIDTVNVKITDSQGINTYDKTSPYFKYSGTKFRYEVEVRPPQPWAYEEDVQAEIDAWDLAVPPVQGVVYEYIP